MNLACRNFLYVVKVGQNIVAGTRKITGLHMSKQIIRQRTQLQQDCSSMWGGEPAKVAEMDALCFQ